MNFWKICTFIGALIGGLFVLGAMADGSAPQQAAAADIAIFFVAAPYCLHGVLFRSKFTEDRRASPPPADKNSSGIDRDAYKNWSDAQG